MTIPIISLSGNPYRIGYEHGKAARSAIKHNVQFYFSFWNYFSGVTRKQILAAATKFVPHIKKLDSELLEELKGVAEGSEMKFEEIVAINSRWELNYAYTPTTPTKAAMDGCTACAVTAEASQDDHTFIGQNWDYKQGLEDTCVLLLIHQDNKPDIIINTEAGIIGHKGFNSSGIGVCLNYLRTSDDFFRPGVPILIKVRSILNSETLPQCVGILTSFMGPNSGNLLLAHGDGEAIDVECLPDDTLFVHPKQGIITHTNHFLSPIYPKKDSCKKLFPDSLIRNHRASRLLLNQYGRLGFDGIKKVLQDHFGYPDSLCRHRNESSHFYEQWETVTSMIIDLTNRKMLYTSGPPCSQAYEEISISDVGNR